MKSKNHQKILICDSLEDTITYQVELLFEDYPALLEIRNIKGLRYFKRAVVIKTLYIFYEKEIEFRKILNKLLFQFQKTYYETIENEVSKLIDSSDKYFKNHIRQYFFKNDVRKRVPAKLSFEGLVNFYSKEVFNILLDKKILKKGEGENGRTYELN